MVKQFLKEMSKLSPVMKFGMKMIDKEEFGEDSSDGSPLIGFLYTIMVIVAFYLAFKCHGRFDLTQFLLACCCAPFYIAYRLAVPCVKALV
jgi:hypothetical protein